MGYDACNGRVRTSVVPGFAFSLLAGGGAQSGMTYGARRRWPARSLARSLREGGRNATWRTESRLLAFAFAQRGESSQGVSPSSVTFPRPGLA